MVCVLWSTDEKKGFPESEELQYGKLDNDKKA